MTEKKQRFISLDEGYDFIIRDTITHNDLCDVDSVIDSYLTSSEGKSKLSNLEKKYESYDEEPFSELIFEEKFEPYAVEPKFKKLKVPEKCGECKSCNAAPTGLPYCHMKAISSVNLQTHISSIDVNIDSRPDWCPIIKINDELDR